MPVLKLFLNVLGFLDILFGAIGSAIIYFVSNGELMEIALLCCATSLCAGLMLFTSINIIEKTSCDEKEDVI